MEGGGWNEIWGGGGAAPVSGVQPGPLCPVYSGRWDTPNLGGGDGLEIGFSVTKGQARLSVAASTDYYVVIFSCVIIVTVGPKIARLKVIRPPRHTRHGKGARAAGEMLSPVPLEPGRTEHRRAVVFPSRIWPSPLLRLSRSTRGGEGGRGERRDISSRSGCEDPCTALSGKRGGILPHAHCAAPFLGPWRAASTSPPNYWILLSALPPHHLLEPASKGQITTALGEGPVAPLSPRLTPAQASRR